jgi:hypothetical protein
MPTEPQLLRGDPAVNAQDIGEVREGRDEVDHDQHLYLQRGRGEEAGVEQASPKGCWVWRARHHDVFFFRFDGA